MNENKFSHLSLNFALLFTFTSLYVANMGCTSLMRAYKDHHKEMKYKYDDHVTVSIGWGANSGIISLKETVIIIDTKLDKYAREFYDSIKHITTGKTVYLINTHLHQDHTSGNYLFNADKIFIPNYSDELWNRFVSEHNSMGKLPYVKVKEKIVIQEDGITIKIIPIGQAHTINDLIVYYEQSKLLFAGDIHFHRYHPRLDKDAGSDPECWSNAIKNIVTNIPFEQIVPGHGSLSKKEDLIALSDYFQDIIINIDNAENMKSVEKKYHYFDNLPKISSFQKTAEYIRNWRNNYE